jgi:hypothetical protein
MSKPHPQAANSPLPSPDPMSKRKKPNIPAKNERELRMLPNNFFQTQFRKLMDCETTNCYI